MIRRFHSIPVAAAALCFILLPDRSSAADEPEVPAAVQVEVNFTSGGEKVVAKAVLHTDLQDQGKSFEGTVTLNSGDGMSWIVSISASIGAGEGSEPVISVSVSDANRTVKAEREGSTSIEPLEIFHSERTWHGPGVYRLAEQDDNVLSLRVRDTPALKEQAAAPAPVPEKKGKEKK